MIAINTLKDPFIASVLMLGLYKRPEPSVSEDVIINKQINKRAGVSPCPKAICLFELIILNKPSSLFLLLSGTALSKIMSFCWTIGWTE